jgi:hypothetical protein
VYDASSVRPYNGLPPEYMRCGNCVGFAESNVTAIRKGEPK